MITTVIFDVGGVLKTETDAAIRRDVMKTLGISAETLEMPWKTLTDKLGRGQIQEKDFWPQLHHLTSARNSLPDESLLMREYVNGHHVNEAVMSIVGRLGRAGYATAVLSNTIASHANFNHEQGVYNGFNVVMLSHEMGLRKPDPEMFKLALETLGVTADRAVLVDDAQKNIAGAQAVGMHGILFTDAPQLEARLKKLGLIF